MKDTYVRVQLSSDESEFYEKIPRSSERGSFLQKFLQNESKQFYSISEIKPRMVKPPS